MLNRYKNVRKRTRFARADYDKDSLKVQSHLTLTPAQMYGMALQGKHSLQKTGYNLPNSRVKLFANDKSNAFLLGFSTGGFVLNGLNAITICLFLG